jgi:antitoxin MazE
MRVAKWGNSLAVRLPSALVDGLKLKEGDELDARLADERTIELFRPETREERIAAMRALSRPLPPDYKFDREWANSRGGDDEDE